MDGSRQAAVTGKFESIYFDFDKFVLRPEAEKTLQDLTSFCKRNPAVQIEIDGFTDEVGRDDYNEKLSLRRGNTTSQYLIQQGVDRSSLVVIAKGERNPVAPNETPSGRQLNRRVEFIIKGADISPVAQTYIIERKMTLYSLAKKYNTTVEELKQLNGLKSDHLEAYRPLRIPTGVDISPQDTSKEPSIVKSPSTKTYTVRKGDTAFSISVKHNMTVERFVELNQIKSNKLKSGQKVLVEPRL